jgi:hypothetical protein
MSVKEKTFSEYSITESKQLIFWENGFYFSLTISRIALWNGPQAATKR